MRLLSTTICLVIFCQLVHGQRVELIWKNDKHDTATVVEVGNNSLKLAGGGEVKVLDLKGVKLLDHSDVCGQVKEKFGDRLPVWYGTMEELKAPVDVQKFKEEVLANPDIPGMDVRLEKYAKQSVTGIFRCANWLWCFSNWCHD